MSMKLKEAAKVTQAAEAVLTDVQTVQGLSGAAAAPQTDRERAPSRAALTRTRSERLPAPTSRIIQAGLIQADLKEGHPAGNSVDQAEDGAQTKKSGNLEGRALETLHEQPAPPESDSMTQSTAMRAEGGGRETTTGAHSATVSLST
ncbi:unnamed protein product [Pleuronectes platessa]|uniref:Uncharacterized protein n=1 Tax=Pleuronectes platessa TaxID=8262 RepID=A0A9N7VD92_PLEPL|nr:unnamed protein product [Pleuronectes platessa]